MPSRTPPHVPTVRIAARLTGGDAYYRGTVSAGGGLTAQALYSLFCEGGPFPRGGLDYGVVATYVMNRR